MRGKISDLFLILNLTRSERQDEETKKRSAWKGLRRYAGPAALPLALLAKSAVHGHARAETFHRAPDNPDLAASVLQEPAQQFLDQHAPRGVSSEPSRPLFR